MLKSSSCLVYDNGIFLPLAQRLGRDFGKVYYYTPWKSGTPTSDKAYIGRNMPGVERVHDFWKYVEKADMVAFFDIYDSDIQDKLRKEGKPVFGSGDAEDLELDRWKFIQKVHEVGLPIPYSVKLKGMENIKKYLQDPKIKDKYIKFNVYRGDSETEHWIDWETNKIWLDDLGSRLGSRQDELEVVICDAIEAVAEFGYDGWCLDGAYPEKCAYGIEEKNALYIGKVSTYEALPIPLKTVNDKFAPVLKGLHYKGGFSTEVRTIKDKKPYFIDPTHREGFPPSCSKAELFNLPEIVWEIAHGRMPVVKETAKYVCEVLIKSPFLLKREVAVSFPKEIEQWVKLINAHYLNGEYHCMPMTDNETLGSVVALGNSVDEVEALCLERIKQIKAFKLMYDEDAFTRAKEAIAKAKKVGFLF